MGTLPTEEEVLTYFEKLSNWGRWGENDQLGTLNLITPEVRARAASLVREGISVSCGRDLDPQTASAVGPGQVLRYMIRTGEGLRDEHRVALNPQIGRSLSGSASEFIGIAYHGLTVTHLDGLSHHFHDAKMYNGYPAELVSAYAGATRLSISEIREGIQTRGVLLDIPAIRGLKWLEPGDGAYPEELDEAEKRQGVQVREGDAVLLRTGNWQRLSEQPKGTPATPGLMGLPGWPGWSAGCIPWLHDRGVAMVGCDTPNDMAPSGFKSMEIGLPLHSIGIPSMGLFLLDNADLDELAVTCERLNRWEFLFTVAPLRMVGGTGSPVNPIATF